MQRVISHNSAAVRCATADCSELSTHFTSADWVTFTEALKLFQSDHLMMLPKFTCLNTIHFEVACKFAFGLGSGEVDSIPQAATARAISTVSAPCSLDLDPVRSPNVSCSVKLCRSSVHLYPMTKAPQHATFVLDSLCNTVTLASCCRHKCSSEKRTRENRAPLS